MQKRSTNGTYRGARTKKGAGERAVGAGPGADEARAPREIGDALEAVVRTLLQGDRLSEGHARRLVSLCAAFPRPVLDWCPTELRMDGKLALAASGETAGFILPLYEAGVRALRVTPEACDLDVLLLAEILADAEQGEIGGLRLHDWFWRGGAIGFAVKLSEPFARVADFVLAQPVDAAEHWAEVGRVAIERWNEAAWKAGERLTAVEIGERYREPMERYHARVLEGSLLLGDAGIEALRELADDPRGWAGLEMEALLKHPGLRHALPEAQLGARVTQMVHAAEEVDARLLDLLGSLSDTAEDESSQSLDNVEVGAAVAAKVTEAGVDEDALLDFVDFAGDASVAGLLEHLCERAVGEGHAMNALAMLMRHWGPRRFLARFRARQLSPALVTGLMKSALDGEVAVGALVEALDGLPAECVVMVLGAIGEIRDRAQPQVERILAESPGEAGALIQNLLQTQAGVRMVGDALRESGGAGWTPRVLRGSLQALLRSGCGREFVLPLYRARGTPIDVRLAALAALDADGELRAEALKWRAGDMMEPAEIRAALKEARAR